MEMSDFNSLVKIAMIKSKLTSVRCFHNQIQECIQDGSGSHDNGEGHLNVALH
ncbi:hypothetical protein X975_25134, partial [Stegodyphus mimosarum]